MLLKKKNQGSAIFLPTTPYAGPASIRIFSTFSISFIDDSATGQIAQSKKAVVSRQKNSKSSTKYTDFGSALGIPVIDNINAHPNGGSV